MRRPLGLHLEALEARETPAVALASTALAGGVADAAATQATITLDGRYVLFTSTATNVVANDLNSVADVFLRDLQTNATERVSVGTDGREANGANDDAPPAISADGRYVLFTSRATNLDTPATNGVINLYRHDRSTNTTLNVSVDSAGLGPTGDILAPALSADGRYVAFRTATPLTPDDTADGSVDVYLRDTQTNTLTRVTTPTSEQPFAVGQASGTVGFAAGAPILVLTTTTALVGGDTNKLADLYAYNYSERTYELVSRSGESQNGGNQATLGHWAITPNGQAVAFLSAATDLALADVPGNPGLFVRNLRSDTTTFVAAAGALTQPSLSDDGRFVPHLGGSNRAFVRDLRNGTSALVSVDSTNTLPVDNCSEPRISGNGRVVVFLSTGTTFLDGFTDKNGDTTPDLYARNLSAGINTLLSAGLDSPTTGANGPIDQFHLSANGVVNVVQTNASTTNLVANDTNTASDIVVSDVPLRPGNLRFGVPTVSVNETAGTVTLTVIRGGGIDGSVTINYSTGGGTAVAGVNYTAATGTLTFADGVASQSFTVPILNDGVQTGNRTFDVTLSEPTGGATIGVTPTETVTIVDAQTLPPPPPPPPPPAPVGSEQFVLSGTNGTAGQFAFGSDGQAKSTGTFTPFASFTGIVRSTAADVNGDGVADVIYATGPGGGALVRIINGLNGADLLSGTTFDAYAGEDFTNIGLYLTAGDIDGDGSADLVVAPDQGGGARVQVFSFSGGSLVQRGNFFGIDDPAFRGGGRIALGDLNADGKLDLVVGAGFGGGPRIALFNGGDLTGNVQSPRKLVGDFVIFEPGLRDGVFVAAGDISGDGKADLIFGGGPGGGPRVTALNGASILASTDPNQEAVKNAPLANFFAFDSTQRGGVRVAVKDADGDTRFDLVVASGDNAPPAARVYLGKNLPTSGQGEPPLQQSLTPFSEPTLTNGVFVG
jgi:Tol biopolymer transport system component